MASIRKYKSKWQAQIRRKGNKSISKSFLYRKDAETWARSMERELDTGSPTVDLNLLKTTSLANLLIRYRDTVAIKKRGQKTETYWINVFLKHRISNLPLSEVSSAIFAAYRDERLDSVKASSVCREFCVYQHAFQVAIDEWGFPLKSNPLLKVKKPSFNDQRTRRLNNGELEKILNYCNDKDYLELKNTIVLAIETGMRRGELLRARKFHFNEYDKTLFIPLTKNGHARTIPLTSTAKNIINNLGDDAFVYSHTMEGLKSAWQRLIKRTNIDGLRFHDLRHEAISRFFEMGLSVPEVALISGHRDYRMLQRYTHLKPEQIALKLK